MIFTKRQKKMSYNIVSPTIYKYDNKYEFFSFLIFLNISIQYFKPNYRNDFQKHKYTYRQLGRSNAS